MPLHVRLAEHCSLRLSQVSKLSFTTPIPAVQLTEKLNQQLQTTQKQLQSFMEEYKIRMKVSQLSSIGYVEQVAHQQLIGCAS